MERSTLLVPPCSFRFMLHPEYEAIKAECEPWLLALAAPPTAAAARFWQDNSLPLLGSLLFGECAKERAVLGTKMTGWFTISDNADDDLSVRGRCTATNHVRRRHDLILACLEGKALSDLLKLAVKLPDGANMARELCSLQDMWKDTSKEMSVTMQSRYREAVSRYLHALRVQAQYRSADTLPGVEEYLNVVHRPASISLQLLVLLEYCLGMELDEETLASELMLRLKDAVLDHMGLYNDLFSYEAEICSGDYFNLPSVILRAAQSPGFTIADAVQQTVSMTQEVEKQCAQLIAEVEKSRLIEKPGVEAYLRGLQTYMAGHVEWSFRTGRYSHTCSKEGLVLPVERLIPPSIAAPRPCPTAQNSLHVTSKHKMLSPFTVHLPRASSGLFRLKYPKIYASYYTPFSLQRSTHSL